MRRSTEMAKNSSKTSGVAPTARTPQCCCFCLDWTAASPGSTPRCCPSCCWEGEVFVLYNVAFVAYLILAAQQHDALRTYTWAMTGFVLPLTVITLVAVLLPRRTTPF
ncbi:MAG: hypothetical protein KIT60_21815 [Burkholderiaceae bacterium]|nr:hypothetical protein [Burkholderiaceae bacterium]